MISLRHDKFERCSRFRHTHTHTHTHTYTGALVHMHTHARTSCKSQKYITLEDETLIYF